jgi:hypothetical protein
MTRVQKRRRARAEAAWRRYRRTQRDEVGQTRSPVMCGLSVALTRAMWALVDADTLYERCRR